MTRRIHKKAPRKAMRRSFSNLRYANSSKVRRIEGAPTLIVHTDGSCNNKNGIGGWGSVIRMQNSTKSKRLFGGYTNTTNNRMELLAAIHALEWITAQGVFNIELYSDSQYVVRGMTEWIIGWKYQGWCTTSGAVVKNKDLWIRLDRLRNKHSVMFHWVRGHNGDQYNEEADKLARKGAQY